MKQKRAALSQKDIKRIKVLELVVNGMVTNQEAAESLKLCRRQISGSGKRTWIGAKQASFTGTEADIPHTRQENTSASKCSASAGKSITTSTSPISPTV